MLFLQCLLGRLHFQKYFRLTTRSKREQNLGYFKWSRACVEMRWPKEKYNIHCKNQYYWRNTNLGDDPIGDIEPKTDGVE